MKIACSLLFLFLACVASVSASDHTNLERGLPTELADAWVTPHMNREIQGRFVWEEDEDDEGRFRIEPRLEYGFLPNWQVELAVPYEWGSGEEEDEIKDALIGVLYNLNQETVVIPSFAVSAEAVFPGEGERVDPEVGLIASKLLGKASLFQRFHLNAFWRHNTDTGHDERDNVFMGVAGYDVRLGTDNTLILDYVWEQQMERGKESSLVEVGLRRQISPPTLVALGIGAGIGSDSPEFRAVLGFQRSF
jgi:hypothetical protein